jgi:predicted transcriptional regulator
VFTAADVKKGVRCQKDRGTGFGTRGTGFGLRGKGDCRFKIQDSRTGGAFFELNACSSAIAFRAILEVPVIEEVDVEAKTLAAIDRGIADADAGLAVPLREVLKLVRIPNSNHRSRVSRFRENPQHLQYVVQSELRPGLPLNAVFEAQ